MKPAESTPVEALDTDTNYLYLVGTMRDETLTRGSKMTARQNAIDYTAAETMTRVYTGDTRTIREIAITVLSISRTPGWVMDVADEAERTSRAWNRFLGEIEKRYQRWA